MRNGISVTTAALASGVLLGLAVLFVRDPATSSFYPACFFHALTGYHCPGCGTLRALYQLLHGNLVGAFLLNPLAVLSLPVFAWWLLRGFVRSVRGRPVPAVFLPGFSIWMLLGVVLVFSVLRNVPHYPFSLLGP